MADADFAEKIAGLFKMLNSSSPSAPVEVLSDKSFSTDSLLECAHQYAVAAKELVERYKSNKAITMTTNVVEKVLSGSKMGLDGPTIRSLLDILDEMVPAFKVGIQLFPEESQEANEEILDCYIMIDAIVRIFLDIHRREMKLKKDAKSVWIPPKEAVSSQKN